MYGWHFLSSDGKLRDGREAPADGVPLKHEGSIQMCVSGLHASERLIDALSYAPGAILCRVRLGGVTKGDDKVVAKRRTIIWRQDATAALKAFARWAALQQIHLWDPPKEVIDWLVWGKSELRSAAGSAADAVARSGADAAADAAAWSAADAAAGSAAGSADGSAASSAADAAAWSAADAAAWSADRSTARSAAKSAASSAARSAAKSIQNDQLRRMVNQARRGRTEWIFEL